MIGKTTATVGNSQIRVRVNSGKKYPFKKQPGVGYIFEGTQAEAEEIFQSQNAMHSYYFTPIFEKEEVKEVASPELGSIEDKSLEELKEMCKELGIKTVPQDKERSMKRLLEAFKLGAGV